MIIQEINIKNFRSLRDVSISGPEQDIWTLVGQNNSGKSAVLNAIRAFYGDYDKVTPDDFNRDADKDEPIEITISYKLEDEEFEDLPEHYRLPGNRLKVTRRFTRENLKGESHGYSLKGSEEIENEEQFFGAKNVQAGKLGEVIYVPAVKDLTSELKTTTKSTLFSKLINRVINDAVSDLDSWHNLVEQTENFAEDLRDPKKETGDYRSIKEIEGELSQMLTSWGIGARLQVNPPTPEDIVIKGADLKFVNDESGFEELPEMMGSGAQRSVVNSLLLLWAKVESQKGQKSRKTFSPNFTLLLYEEPEALLHYDQEKKLLKYLEDLVNTTSTQVIACTHSPNILSTKENALQSISRFEKSMQQTQVYKANQKYLKDLDQTKGIFDFVLWLNPDRNTMFFVDRVILVEGPADKVFLNYLISENDICSNVYVVDCGSKQNIPRFMELCCVFGLKHSVLFDRDNDKNENHKQWNQDIEKSRNTYTDAIKDLPDELGNYLNFSISKDGYRKPLETLEALRQDSLSDEKRDEFIAFVENN